MSFSYTGDPTDSQVNSVRFYIQDTVSTDVLLQDEEIQFLITQWFPLSNSLIYVAAVCAEIVASKFAREISTSADGVSVGAEALQQKYQTLAEQLRKQYIREVSASSSVEFASKIWDLAYDDSIKPLSFSIGMDDNPNAGTQPPPRGYSSYYNYYYGY
jgi:hypothetical protein